MSNSIKHWYLPVIGGIILLIIGFWMIANPQGGFKSMTLIFEWSFILFGIVEIIFAINIRKVIHAWGWYLIGGIASLFIGIILIKHPVLSALSLAFYIGLVVLFKSSEAVGKAIDLMRLNIPGGGWLLFWGILGLIFAFILLWDPTMAGLSAVIWVSMAFIFMGVFNLALGFQLKKIK